MRVGDINFMIQSKDYASARAHLAKHYNDLHPLLASQKELELAISQGDSRLVNCCLIKHIILFQA
jgi:hypothetical protein